MYTCIFADDSYTSGHFVDSTNILKNTIKRFFRTFSVKYISYWKIQNCEQKHHGRLTRNNSRLGWNWLKMLYSICIEYIASINKMLLRKIIFLLYSTIV